MALFEVFIPSPDPDGFNITARIRADSWMQALRSGLTRLGDTADVRNVLCDINETGIDVTEPASGRVFRIRELVDGATATPVIPAPAPIVAAPAPAVRATVASPAAPRPIVGAPPRAPAPLPQPPVAKVPSPRPVVPAPVVAPVAVQAPPTPLLRPRFQAQVQEETVTQEKATGSPVQIGRVATPEERIADLLSDMLDATQQMYDKPDLRAAADYLLDLAVKAVPSESGAVFISDINASDLYFAAARGPKATEVMKFRVPMGQGIVGFAAQEGVALAVSDVHRDPRFYAAISKAIGYETRSILCAPAQLEGRVFGAIELINKSSGSTFTGPEVAVVDFLAHEWADYLVNTGQTGD
ncbi:MAG: GAF domain-containing protein [Myxococcota bacterium]